MFSIDQVLEKLKAGEPVQLCDIYSAVSLEGKAGEEKRRTALSAWISNAASSEDIDAVVAELSAIKATVTTSDGRLTTITTNTGTTATNTGATSTNVLNLFNLVDTMEAHGRLQVETLGMPSVPRQIAVTATSAAQQLTASCRRISIVATGCAMRFRVGPTSVNAQTTDHLIQQDERMDIHVNASSWINVIRDAAATSNGTLNITELTA